MTQGGLKTKTILDGKTKENPSVLLLSQVIKLFCQRTYSVFHLLLLHLTMRKSLAACFRLTSSLRASDNYRRDLLPPPSPHYG